MRRLAECPVCGEGRCVAWSDWRGYCYRFAVTWVKVKDSYFWKGKECKKNIALSEKSCGLKSGQVLPGGKGGGFYKSRSPFTYQEVFDFEKRKYGDEESLAR